MSMRAIVVFGSALAMGATLNAQAQKPQLGFSFRAPLEGKVVKGAPYSAEIETESVQTLGDGNRIVHRSTGRVYRDAEGRVRREDKSGSTETITITWSATTAARSSRSQTPRSKPRSCAPRSGWATASTRTRSCCAASAATAAPAD